MQDQYYVDDNNYFDNYYQDKPNIPYPNDLHKEDTIGIIEGLDFKKELREIFLEVKGHHFDYENDMWSQEPIDAPIMNSLGISNLMNTLRTISRKILTMSSYDFDELKPRIAVYAKRNIAHFLAYSEEYELDELNYNQISNYIFTFCDAAYHKAKGAGDRNVVRGTYSEALLAGMMGKNKQGEMNQAKPGGLLGWFKKR